VKRRTLRIIIGLLICIIIVVAITILILKISSRHRYEETVSEIVYVEDRNVIFNSDVKIIDFIRKMDGKLVENTKVDTTKLGQHKAKFKYINTKKKEFELEIEYNVIDVTKPTIWLGSSYSVTKNSDVDLLEKIMCADDLDDNPKCEIIGDYDISKVGSYNLTFKATDHSDNVTTKDFVLYVKEPVKQSGGSSGGTVYKTPIKEAYDNYKKDDTKIGIDVSEWQGEIDFDKVKEAGVEFAFVRVGGTKGIDKEYFVDKQFKRNMEGFNRVGIPVGVYFFSYAKSEASAIKDAKWVIEQIKPYKVDLPVVYDWENWSFYNAFNNSFYTLNHNANKFLDTVKAAGYKGMLYGSKTYLDKIWLNIEYPIWGAHYTNDIVDYRNIYDYVQICDNGVINGINGFVDLDIMYIK